MNIYEVNCPALAPLKESMERILSNLCEDNELDVNEVLGKSRKAHLVKLRADFSKYCYRFATLEEIGDYLNRDHTSIIHYLKHRYD